MKKVLAGGFLFCIWNYSLGSVSFSLSDRKKYALKSSYYAFFSLQLCSLFSFCCRKSCQKAHLKHFEILNITDVDYYNWNYILICLSIMSNILITWLYFWFICRGPQSPVRSGNEIVRPYSKPSRSARGRPVQLAPPIAINWAIIQTGGGEEQTFFFHRI